MKVEYKYIEPPQDHEVLVRMLARPINPSDLIPISGAYSHRIFLPNIPGYEGVGIYGIGIKLYQLINGKKLFII